jgi:hypothetical protein
MEFGTFTGNLTFEENEWDLKGKLCLNCGLKQNYGSFNSQENSTGKYCNICKPCLYIMKFHGAGDGNMCKYILYMHPKRNSVEYRHLADYWAKCRYHFNGNFSGNTALLYPFHISLTSWMNETMAEKIRGICRKEFSQMGRISDLKKFYYPMVRDSPFLGIGLVSEILTKKIKKLKGFPVKNGIHLSLYHFPGIIWDSSECKKESIIRANKLLDLPPLNTWSDEFTVILWKTDNCKKWEIVEEFS